MHLLGDIAVLTTLIVLCYESINKVTSESTFNFDNVQPINSGWAKIVGMGISTIEGIGVVLPIKESMVDKKKFNLVVYIGNLFISLILIGFPLIMYLCYQDKTAEIVLTNLPTDKIYVQVMLCFLVFSIIIVYPVSLYPAYLIIENILFKKLKENEKKPMGRLVKENIMRTFIVSCGIFIGIISIDKFDVMLSLAGSAIMTPIAFILPTFFHYKLFKDKQSCFRSCVDLGISISGFLIAVIVFVFTLI